MTKTFSSNIANDLFIGPDGNLSIYTGVAAVLQLCEHAVKAQLGEMVLDQQRGMPNFQTVWNGTPNVAQFESYLRATILSVEGVTDITALAIDATTDAVRYTATIKTIYGEAKFNG